jgi:uncharacterized protein (TIGR02145 family)
MSSSSLAPSSSSSVGFSGTYGSLLYEGQTYKTVRIGEQVWFAENLNYAAKGSKCYGNSEANCDTYGRLYDWSTAMNNSASSKANPSGVQGVCPSGWHLPSDAEWGVLMTAVGGANTAGTKLKATSGWNDYNGASGNGTDDYGFSALPGGIGNSDGRFGSVAGYYGYWWSATESHPSYAYSRRMSFSSSVGSRLGGSDMNGDYGDKSFYFFSVRCLQD